MVPQEFQRTAHLGLDCFDGNILNFLNLGIAQVVETIHGKDDPLILLEHALKYAPMIPNAQTLYIDGMGHDIPRVNNDEITQAMITNFERA